MISEKLNLRPSEEAATRLLLPLIVGGALFMQTLDATIITTALPAMGRSLGENPIRLNLAITAYLLSVAIFIPISGWTADRFGARPVFRTAIAIFAVSSILCGMSQTLFQLVGSRVLQGIGGAMMMPVGRLLVLRSIPKSDLVRAMSTLTTPAILGPVLGPPLGGLLVTYASWHWIFFVNVPIGILGFALVSLFIKNVPSPIASPLDRSGFALSGVGMAGLVLGFDLAGRGILATRVVIVFLLVGTVCAVIYYYYAKRTPNPILDPSLLDIPTFKVATIGGSLCRTSLGAMPFLMALLLQVGFGYSPLAAGLISLAGGMGALMNKAAIRLITRWLGFRLLLISATVFHALLLFNYGLFRVNTPVVVIIAVLFVGGFIRSLLFTSVNAFTYTDILPQRLSASNTLTSVAQQLSLSVGVAVAALSINLSMSLNGSTVLTAMDICPAFFVISSISTVALVYFFRLAPDVGAEMRG